MKQFLYSRWLAVLALAVLHLEFALSAQIGDVLTATRQSAVGVLKVSVTDDVDAVALEYRKSPKSPWLKSLTKTNDPGSREVVLSVPAILRKSELRVVVFKTRPTPTGLKFSKSAGDSSLTIAKIPAGTKLSLEAFDPASKSWKNVALAEAANGGGAVKINIPAKNRKSELRVVPVVSSKPSTISRKFSDRFRKGKSDFAGREAPPETNGYDSMRLASATEARSPDVNSSDANTVEEADIWRVRGNRVYFFNQLRGLQVIDTTNRTSPEIVSSLRMPAVGEDMYVLSQDRVLLVRRDYSGESKTFVVLVDCSKPSAAVSKKIELPGWYADSRIVNNRLVIATQFWDAASNTQKSALSVIQNLDSSLDIASTRQFDTAISVMGAGTDFLWVAGSDWRNWNQTPLTLFPINALPALSNPSSVTLQGNIQDKFKVHQKGNSLFAITQSWGGDWRQKTKLESFTLNGGTIQPAATLPLVEGESLHASRFDGDHVYVVTFRNVDPLWIIDISDTANPKIVSELEVSGWSSHIQPVGDCLAAVGVEGGKVVASLFDVSDASKPSLASRVEVGGDKNWTWSEANWNEKAAAILPEQNLILLPYQSWTWGSGNDCAVQIIDLDASAKTLTKRGVVKHAFQPRRATALEQGILASISNRELLLVDTSDRDNPSVLSDSMLAFGADRILFANDQWIVHCEDGGWNSGNATLRVSETNDPETILAEKILPGNLILAGGAKGSKLAVASLDSSSPDKSHFLVYDATALPNLVESGRAAANFNGASPYGSRTDLLWPTDQLAVVSSVDSGWCGWGIVPRLSEARIVAYCGWPGYWRQNSNIRLFAFDLSTATPKAGSIIDFADQSFSNTSKLFAADGLVVFSAEKTELEIQKASNPAKTTARIPKPISLPRRILNSYLNVVDYADPTAPTRWPAASLPGKLESIGDFDRAAGIVFTSSPSAEAGDRITALLFESGIASQVATLELKPGQPRSLSGRSVFSSDGNRLCLRILDQNGAFVAKPDLKNLPWNPAELLANDQYLVFRNGAEVGLVDSLFAGDVSVWTMDSWIYWELERGRQFSDGLAIPLGSYGVEVLK